MKGSVANMEEGALPVSPLKPLKNRLCLIKALGLPLRIEDEEGTIVTNKKTCGCIAILLLPIMSYSIGFIGFATQTELKTKKIEDLFHDKGIRKWDINCSMIYYSILGFLPFIYLYLYHGLGPKFTKFIQSYQSTYISLEHGEYEILFSVPLGNEILMFFL